ncbi:MAG: hypothetical protein LBJ67_06365 [Planctomycetaceae bacterium]|jgi:hypothetical protein|nr:hypothetical protein [Planctomycetaceae bacterium]
MNQQITYRQKIDYLVNQYSAHLFYYEEDGSLVFDHTGKHIFHVPNVITDDDLEKLETFLQEKNKEEETKENTPTKKHLYLKMPLIPFDTKDILQQLIEAVQSASQDSEIELKICFQTLPDYWQKTIDDFSGCFKDQIQKAALQIVFRGCFEKMSDNEKQFLFDNKIQIEYVHDIIAENGNFGLNTRKVIRDFSEFGFRVPFVWYVNHFNIAMIPPMIDEAMLINHHSGFLLPVVEEQTNLFSCYSEYKMPSSEEYISFLTKIYENYPHYDDVLYPLNISLSRSLPEGFTIPDQRYMFDVKTGQLLSEDFSSFYHKVINFFTYIFLWQRWIVFDTCRQLSP